ncbi:AraC family transcriptional regulator [Ochrobactrum sp. WV_118_8]|uniref:Helix-turn-helix transcriptional regulator n=1 Tax=Brucella anthropi TaxID=529 RepID=A0A6L3Z9Y1_BRUAN|nr:AraC family transcriptional regulator [Brucella anthropi]KAB2773005.1 helix-turn-helix transcriptional regulator [Brucella anthropi]UVV66311.1 AraC family transcriptional regulator [Brucella anthropi]
MIGCLRIDRVCFMIFIPLPFVSTLLLLLLLAVLLHRFGWNGANRPFLFVLGLSALQSLIVGLRWGYGVTELRYVLPVLASCLPGLTLTSFRSLIHRDEAGDNVLGWFHVLPPFGVAALVYFAPGLIDLALIGLYVGYAFALLLLGRSGPDALDAARLDSAVAAHRALVIAAASLCLSALFDLVVVLDFQWQKGDSAAAIIGNGNLLGLFLIGLTALVAARAKVAPELDFETAPPEPNAEADRNVLDKIEALLTEQRLFLDENLTLSRLARRACIPTRQISGAINRLTGKNVSRFINDYRIAEACRRLQKSDTSITAVMFESGFQTKSNFNREFRRVTSLSPADWRDKNRLS